MLAKPVSSFLIAPTGQASSQGLANKLRDYGNLRDVLLKVTRNGVAGDMDIIPTRCRDLHLKQFCLEDIAPAVLIILITHIIIQSLCLILDSRN